MNRDDRKVLRHAVMIALFVVLAGAALAADLPSVDCAVVKAHIAEHGRAKAIVWARQQGYSWADIWRIRKQCGV